MTDKIDRPKRVRGERERRQDAQWRQRKKHEREELQRTAQTLMSQWTQLQQAQGLLSCVGECKVDVDNTEISWNGDDMTSPLAKKRKTTPEVETSVWQRKATAMRRERMQAELQNVTLKKAVALETKAAKSLRELLNKRPSLPRSVIDNLKQSVCAQPPPQSPRCSQCCNPTTLHINPTAVKQEIQASLKRMYAQASTVLDSSMSDPSLSFSFGVRLDPTAGLTIHVTSLTPLNCRADHAAKLLGLSCQIPHSNGLDSACSIPEPRVTGCKSDGQQFTVEMGSPYQTVILDGFNSMHRSNDDDRILILWTAISFDRCGALCFRECSWLSVLRSPSNPEHESVIRSHYTVNAEKKIDFAVIDGEHIDRVRDRALHALGKRIQQRYLAMQRRLLRSTGQGDLINFIGA